MGKFCQFCFSYFSQLLLLSSFFNKGNSCEIENSKYFDAMVEMVYFLNMFLYCKIVISFLELFAVTCFLCILQTSKQEKIHQFQQNVKNVNIWLLWWRHQMMIKVTFVNFLSRLIPYCQYSTKFHVKWTKIFWDTCFFTYPPAPPSLQFFWEI